MKKKADYILLVLLLAVIALFLFATWKLFGIYVEYRKGTETYEKLQDYVQDSDKDATKDPDSRDDSSNGYLQIDFAGLKKENPDVIAWIHVPALDISYPVVQGKDNSYYLHHMFDGQVNKNGSIFVDYHNHSDFTDSNTIIYGHNMKNGSMFGKLKKYQDKSLYKKYPCFYIYVPGYVLEYRVLSCYAGRNRSAGYTYSFSEIEDFQKFLEKIQSYAGYDTKTKVSDSDRIVTLSTCVSSNRNYRYLIHGKLTQRIQNEGN